MRAVRGASGIGTSRVVAVVIAAFVSASSLADTRSWVGAAGEWHNTANWDGGVSLPGPGDDVEILNAGASVLLTGSVSVVSLTLSRTLTFTNWSTCLNVGQDVTIQNGGVMTCAGPFTNAPAMSNRVYVVCSNFLVAAGGSVNVDAKGYAGGVSGVHMHGWGPGGGAGAYYILEGGSYGGFGHLTTPNTYYYYSLGNGPYGAPEAPEAPGSGGGAVRIVATGCVTVNGAVSANGETTWAAWSGAPCGSGGGIYIDCDRFAGTNGVVRANGGDNHSGYTGYAEGGGGRIAIHYNTDSQGGIPIPTVQFSALPGKDAAGKGYFGDIGTLWFPDTRFWSTDMALLQGQLFGVTNWTTPSLTLANRWIGFSPEGFHLTVTGGVRVDGLYAGLSLGGSLSANYCGGGDAGNAQYRYGEGAPPRLTVGGDLLITNKARVFVYSAATNAVYPEYGARVSVVGALRIATNSWLHLSSHPANGGAVKITVNNLAVNAGGTIRADKGYAGGIAPYGDGYGSGGGSGGSYYGPHGAGYGGVGGGCSVTYGLSNAPVQPGSGGEAGGGDRSAAGKPGGGLVWIEADGRVDLDGTISADPPAWGTSGGTGGGGSGGGVYLRCKTFAGSSSGTLSAKGASTSSGGGGGGGRIAVWRFKDVSTGAVSTSVTNGAGSVAGATVGSIVWDWIPPKATTIMIR